MAGKKEMFSLHFFNFVLEYAIRRVNLNQIGLKLNGTRQLLIYVFDVNILSGSVHNMKNFRSLLFASMEIRLK